MSLTKRFSIVLLIITTVASTAVAYNSDGHRVIALMAFEVMEEHARDDFIDLLRHHPRFTEDFMNRMPDNVRNGSQGTRDRWLISQAGVWPDIARGLSGRDRGRFHRGNWHHVNLRFFASDAHRTALEPGLPDLDFGITDDRDDKDYNIVQAIRNSARIVEDRNLPKSERAVHLCWLVHIVADVHQALHTTALFSPNLFPKGDRGGNSLRVQQGNLHSIWDRRLGSGRTFNRLRRDAVEMLDDEELNDCGNGCVQQMNAETWISEGKVVATTFAYTPDIIAALLKAETTGDAMERIELSDQYFADAGRINRERAVKAAFRLGVLLESSIGEEDE